MKRLLLPIIILLLLFSCSKEPLEISTFENTAMNHLLIPVDDTRQSLMFTSDRLLTYSNDRFYDNDREYYIEDNVLVIYPCLDRTRIVRWRYNLIDEKSIELANHLYIIE